MPRTPRKWPLPHKQCDDTSITTSSGKFTFYPGTSMTFDEAKKFCKKEGEILAPITNRDDFDTLHKFASGCTNIGLGRDYFAGLEMITPEFGYFTNGVVYDEEKHGSFCWVSKKKFKLPASWVTYFGTRLEERRGTQSYFGKDSFLAQSSVICLKPAISTSTCN